MQSASPKLLVVDDEESDQLILRRLLGGRFQLATANSAKTALRVLRSQGPFAVVITDLYMPGTQGVDFLRMVREGWPDTVRVLISGSEDFNVAARAINDGAVYRVLSKSWQIERLIGAIDEAVCHYRQELATRLAIERMLSAATNSMIDMLAMARPEKFAELLRVHRWVCEMLEGIGMAGNWEIEAAALLSRLDVLAERPGDAVLATLNDHLLGSIPRLSGVHAIIYHQGLAFAGDGAGLSGHAIPLGSRMLKLANDFDRLLCEGQYESAWALARLRQREGQYDPDLLNVLAAAIARDEAELSGIDEFVELRDLKPGMVFVDGVRTTAGQLIVAGGARATPSLIKRLKLLARVLEIHEPLSVWATFD